MPSTIGNIITTSLLTLICSAVLFIFYRRAVAPILKHYNIVPLRDLSSAISNRYNRHRYTRLGDEDRYLDEPGDEANEGGVDGQSRRERRLSRDLEEGFKDDSDDEDGTDSRLRGSSRRENISSAQ